MQRYRDFVIFKTAAAILVFQKFDVLTVIALKGFICVSLPNFIKIGQAAVEIWPFNGFSKMAAFDDYLVVSIIMQNLVEVDVVVSVV